MSRWMLVGLMMLTAQVGWSARMERGPIRAPHSTLDVANPQDENYVLRNGTIALNFTNWGYFGNDGPAQSGALEDPCSGEWAPQFEYPEGSGAQYLFQGGVWVGAEIVEEGNSHSPVSVGTDGWQNPSINEFHAGEYPDHGIVLRSNLPDAQDCFGNSIYDPSARANVEAVAVYTDTLMDGLFVLPDPSDGPHEPLGIEITQTALLWTSPEYARFVVLEFTVRNIGESLLKDPVLGMYLDGDVGIVGNNNEHVDDITGAFRVDGDITKTIAWIADNDGRPDEGGEFVLPHAIGFSGLSITDDPFSLNQPGKYNWWNPNGDLSLDFGPAWQDGPDWTIQYGTPEVDAYRYDILGWGEHDYGQYALAANHPAQNDEYPCHPGSNHDWRNVNLDNGTRDDIADGYDTRFLLSWGQVGLFDFEDEEGLCHYRLNPGEEFTFTGVMLIGDYFHDPENPQPNPTHLDSTLFSYAGLLETFERANQLFEAGFSFQPPTPVTNLHATAGQSGAIPLAWNAPLVGGVAGYRVFGRPDSGHGARVEFTTGLITDLQYTVNGLVNGAYWMIEVQTEDALGNHSAFESEMMSVGAIPNDVVLHGESLNGLNTLTWDAVDDPTFTSYRLERTTAFDTLVFDNLTATTYVDGEVASGRPYTYTLYLQNSLGIMSLPSNSVSLTPFAPLQSSLVYDETKRPTGTDMQRGAVNDSLVRVWYTNLLNDINEPHEYLEVANNEPPLSLEILATHSIVIWHSENPRLSNYIYADEREQILREYVRIGGKLIRFGRQWLTAAGLFPGRNNWAGTLDLLQPMTFDSVWASMGYSAPQPELQERTVGAQAFIPDWPSLTWDEGKVAALEFAGHTDFEYLFGIDLFWPIGNTYPLYTVTLHPQDFTDFDNAPCGVVGAGIIFYGFPLYFVPEEQAQDLMAASLELLRTQVLETPAPPNEPLPTTITLSQNYPNPFNPTTVIEFQLPSAMQGALRVYNIRGQIVTTLVNGNLSAGSHRVEFDASALASGLYFYRLETGDVALTKKMLLLK